MGWDAHAETKQGKALSINWNHRTTKPPRLRAPHIRKAFEEARRQVMASTNQVDGLLDIGSLNCSSCALMLQKATGVNAWSEIPLSPSRVYKLNAEANWDFTYKVGDGWAYYSAKVFLETCANLGLGIRFTF